VAEEPAGIFISYRRDESAGYAGRIADRFIEHFGEARVFRDIDSMEPGLDFVVAIERALESCAVVLVVIGRNWTSTLREHEQTGQEDYMQLEVATALKRNDVRVIPVLVQGASMPRAEELPDDLSALRRRNAIELHDSSWNEEIRRLITTLDRVLERRPVEKRESGNAPANQGRVPTGARENSSAIQGGGPAGRTEGTLWATYIIRGLIGAVVVLFILLLLLRLL
jgi:TIR domain